ncbi:hypothetical protein BC628DRAFT_1319465 [Trametes gibbosa]|nr:hypothetical protein BC628DRAFT_1319465 [Trametes gibbosa]
MHLIWENVVKNLMALWSGNYKGLDEGKGSYQFPPAVWEAIGKASAASGNNIPYVFGPRPPNVASDKTSWTADTRSFWMLYMAPILLKNRFSHYKYYNHLLELIHLLHICLQFEITDDDLRDIREGFSKWVQKYEDLYYQHDPHRLSACPLTIHALLHIADGIRLTGPVWATWAFPMERYCGSLQPAIRSRRHPYSSLNRYVLDRARLDHIKLLYSLHTKLAFHPPQVQTGVSIPSYTTCVLLAPHRPITLEGGLLTKLLAALATRYSATPAALRAAVSKDAHEWGKLRITNDGDTIRASALDAGAEDGRDSSFVRYEQLVDKNARYHNRPIILEKKTFYGQLQRILVIELAPVPSANPPQLTPSTLLFGVIRQCVITSAHNVLDIHYYKKLGRVEVVDITTVQCVVGRVSLEQSEYAIIDRSGSLARAIYAEDGRY